MNRDVTLAIFNLNDPSAIPVLSPKAALYEYEDVEDEDEGENAEEEDNDEDKDEDGRPTWMGARRIKGTHWRSRLMEKTCS